MPNVFEVNNRSEEGLMATRSMKEKAFPSQKSSRSLPIDENRLVCFGAAPISHIVSSQGDTHYIYVFLGCLVVFWGKLVSTKRNSPSYQTVFILVEQRCGNMQVERVCFGSLRPCFGSPDEIRLMESFATPGNPMTNITKSYNI